MYGEGDSVLKVLIYMLVRMLKFQKYVFLILLVAFQLSCTKKIEVENVKEECDLSLFHGVRPDMKSKKFFSVMGEPNEWIDVDEDGEESHDAVYYFSDHKLVGCWDGEYPTIGVVEYVPYQNYPFRLDRFLKNPQQYDIDKNTEKFKIYSNGVWWFTVYQKNFKIKKIQFWNVD